MKTSLHPILPPLRDIRSAAAAVSLRDERVEIKQGWDCSKGQTTPADIQTSVKLQAFLGFFNGIYPKLYGPRRGDFDGALAQFFFNRVVERDGVEYVQSIKKNLGTYTMDIPFDAMVFPAFEKAKVTVYSRAKYEYFRIAWKNMRPQHWVVLALPVGHSHDIGIEGRCDGTGQLRPLEMDDQAAVGPLRAKSYTPKTPKSRILRGLTKRAGAAKIDAEIEKLKKKKAELLKKAAELEAG